MNKKIVIVCGTMESGGAERVISILTKPLSDFFDNVYLITWKNAELFYKIDQKVKYYDLTTLTKSNNLIKKMIIFRKLINKISPDLILSFLTPFNMLTIFSLLFTQYKIVISERLDPRYLKGGLLMKFIRNQLYRLSNGIICQTNYIKHLYK